MKKSIIVFLQTKDGGVLTPLNSLTEALGTHRVMDHSPMHNSNDVRDGYIYIIHYPEGTDIKKAMNVVQEEVDRCLPVNYSASVREAENL